MTETLVEMADNGRLVIPAAIRTALGLSGSERFVIKCQDGSITLTPVGVIPVDRMLPITPDLAAAAARAASDQSHQATRAQMRQRLTDLTTP